MSKTTGQRNLTMMIMACLLFAIAQSHSWLECAKYTASAARNDVGPVLTTNAYDKARCKGFPRQFSLRQGGNAAFGADTGFNVQPGPQWCNGRTNTYGANEPMAEYSPGEIVRLTWPAKNHDAESCTNPFIPDTEMKIYVNPTAIAENQISGANGPADISQWTLVVDFKTTQINPDGTAMANAEGFQRCPAFCENTDKAVCFQDMRIPTNLGLTQGNIYTFMWFWIFNNGGANTAYTTCWEARIVAPSGNPAPAPQPGATPSPGGNTPAPGSTSSLFIQVNSTGGTMNQESLVNAVASQLGIQSCAVVVTAFSGSVNPTTNVQSFNIFFLANVATADVTAKIAIVSSAAFSAAMVTGGTVVVIAPTQGGAAAQDSCGGTTTNVQQTSYSIEAIIGVRSLALTVVDLATAIDEISNSTIGVNPDVGCQVTQTPAAPAGSTNFACSIIAFTPPDASAVSTFVGGSSFALILASRLSCCVAADIQILAVSTNVQGVVVTGAAAVLRADVAFVVAVVSALWAMFS